MPYIGNQPLTAAFVTDKFSGTGSLTTFTMSIAPASTSSMLVAITGVIQDPSTYAINGTTLTFSTAPPNGLENISVRYLGIPASGVTTTAYRTVVEQLAYPNQTTFSVPSYTVGYIDVYRNGARLGSADFTATSGTTIVLANAASANELIVTESFYVSSINNAIPAVAGAVTSAYLAPESVTADKIPDGAITPTELSTGAPSWDSSGNLSFNSGYGSTAKAFGCRAWVNFNGTGTVAIRASGNVSSITDGGTGIYTINFTTAMPDANYSVTQTPYEVGGTTWNVGGVRSGSVAAGSVGITLLNYTSAGYVDSAYVFVSIFR